MLVLPCFSVSVLRNSHHLAELSLGGCAIPQGSTVELLQALSLTTSLRVLDFTDVQLSVEGAQHLGMW